MWFCCWKNSYFLLIVVIPRVYCKPKLHCVSVTWFSYWFRRPACPKFVELSPFSFTVAFPIVVFYTLFFSLCFNGYWTMFSLMYNMHPKTRNRRNTKTKMSILKEEITPSQTRKNPHFLLIFYFWFDGKKFRLF